MDLSSLTEFITLDLSLDRGRYRETDRRVSEVEGRVDDLQHDLRLEVRRLAEQNERLASLCLAMATVLHDRLGVDPTALKDIAAAQVDRVRALLGTSEGCQACGRPFHRAVKRCIWCGEPRPEPAPQ